MLTITYSIKSDFMLNKLQSDSQGVWICTYGQINM